MTELERLRARRRELLADQETWRQRAEVLSAALVEQIMEQRASVKQGAGTNTLDGRVRGRAMGALA